MGLWDTLTGKDAADASRRAAADTYAKQTGAVNDQLGSAEQHRQTFSPWVGTGTVANDSVRNLLADPSSVRSLPGYQFGLDQGIKSIDRSALSNGNLFSGKTGKALTNFATNYADKTYGDQLARLLGVSQQGLQANTAGEGGALGARTSAYNNLFGSAGTIGQGDIAAANAQSKGLQNLLNLGGSLIGSAFSGGTGGFGNTIGSLLGPKGGYTGFTSG